MRARGTSIAVALVLAACRSGGETRAPEPLPDEPIPILLGPAPLQNPLNLWDVWIEGSPDHSTVGRVDDIPITIDDLESQSVGVFGRVAERLYEARERAWRWQLERTALERVASKRGKSLEGMLRAAFAKLPRPTEEQLVAMDPDRRLAEMSPEETQRALRSLWRIHAWSVERSLLVHEGLDGVDYQRLRVNINDPIYQQPQTVIARIGDREITRLDLRKLEGYAAEIARREYHHHAATQFEEYVDRLLVTREAKQLGITAEELEKLELDKAGPIRAAEVKAFIAESPEYAEHPEGYERAKDNVRRLRIIESKRQLIQRLRDVSEIEFYLKEPGWPDVDIEPLAPRAHGPADAPHVLVAMHGLACDNCARGSMLVQMIASRYPDQLRIVSADYFSRQRLSSYRGALALRCADEQGDWWPLFERLTRDFGKGTVGELVDRARESGFDPDAFERCMEEDRYLPIVFENVDLAERLGLERNVPGLFINGMRLGDLGKPGLVMEQVAEALGLSKD